MVHSISIYPNQAPIRYNIFIRDLENSQDQHIRGACFEVNMLGVNSSHTVNVETSSSFQDSIYGSNEQSSEPNISFEVDSVEDDEYFEDVYSSKSGSYSDEYFDMEEVSVEE